jgi:hypothetical protein
VTAPESFMGFVVLPCSAPECPCFIRALFEECDPERAWTEIVRTAAEYGWTVNALDPRQVPHDCHCDHSKDGARDPR